VLKRLLIANRGEIACRIIRTARRMGIETVAVFSDVDRDALHVRAADRAEHIGGAAARDSYLDIEALLAAAARSGADSVHPGYGFVAENAEFAQACAAAGLIFVGPTPEAMRAMGSKIEAKRIVAAAGTPVVPGYQDSQDGATLAAEAERLGYPLLIKASAGGGGKGMRLVEDPGGFKTALAAARREAAAAFGEDDVLLERFLTRPKHLEVQILADTHGRTLSLFERDCSVQRRHQKVVEEAPGPSVDEALRARMGEAAVAAAQAIGYVGAGTVEFISEDDEFYFMEMNTRLQVEHPVTEAILGLDLVEWQLRVAAGEALSLTPEELVIDGHAVEVRVYAENPRRKFLPSTGRLVHVGFPSGVRIDSGVGSGSEVTVHYDPMIAKIIAHGTNRADAIERLDRALAATEIAGVEHNVPFLRRVLADEDFLAGDYTTALIESRGDALIPASRPEALAVAAVAALRERAGDSPWQRGDGFRLNRRGRERLTLRYDGSTQQVQVDVTSNGYDVSVAKTFFAVRDISVSESVSEADSADGSGSGSEHRFVATINGSQVRWRIVRDGLDWYLLAGGASERVTEIEPDAASFADQGSGDGRVLAPMPGQLLSVEVKQGAAVKRDQPLMVLEAMKMEHVIVAPIDGHVTELPVSVGDRITEGSVLAVVSAD
jgi:3-methylcrotonyl-CoA carboxylase alpha subunit